MWRDLSSTDLHNHVLMHQIGSLSATPLLRYFATQMRSARMALDLAGFPRNHAIGISEQTQCTTVTTNPATSTQGWQSWA